MLGHSGSSTPLKTPTVLGGEAVLRGVYSSLRFGAQCLMAIMKPNAEPLGEWGFPHNQEQEPGEQAL